MRRTVLIAAALSVGWPASALDLRLTDSYSLDRPASLDYDPDYCALWIANEGPEAILVTLDGREIQRIGSDLRRIKAIALEGEDLIVADGFGNFQRVSKRGDPLGSPFATSEGWADTEGIATDDDGTLITVEDDPEWLSWLAPDGTLIRRIDTLTLDPPLTEAQGIVRDSRTGHLLIVDDREGTNSLYEFDAEGRLLATAPLIEYGSDPEGIAIRQGSNQLFIAFDGGALIAVFDYTPTLPEGVDALPPAPDCVMF